MTHNTSGIEDVESSPVPMIERKSDVYITEQVALFIEDSINKGNLEEGSILPSERRLCEIYKVSRITVRSALEILRERGLIEKHHGIGNIISSYKNRTIPKTRLIACLTFPSKTFTHYIVSGICKYVENTDSQIVMLDTTFNIHKERKAIKDMSKKVVGFIIIPCESKFNLDIYTELASRKFPVVFVDHYHPGIKISSVTTDNRQGGYLAAKHLISLGIRRLVFLSPPLNTALKNRLEGFMQALDAHKIKPLLVRHSGSVPEPGVELIKKLRDEKILHKIEGIFAGNDVTAAQIMQELKKDGFRFPEDINIVGFDDIEIARYLTPPLTTIRQPLFEMGYQAAKLLNEMIEGKSERYQEIRLKPEIIIRGSTCTLQKGREK
jgi:DNA-binding LacI/PurR family transcriptional regulator